VFKIPIAWDSYPHDMAHQLFMGVKSNCERRSYQEDGFMSSVTTFMSGGHENKSLYHVKKEKFGN
jgi:hypothetical protein